ncbi:SDR family oxidoreductase [Niveibacterium umoris]|uniref:NAD(P)-dependent dehydrogenase (Short-subunit alcohol dehydrogenase family) n=1 Tax=Niveibacterium umoris TaxID=1193620 RepID=A0A840BL02_9RHOO|nr:SDR family oxidoreductase [Niveibacterium umoris]MBB4013124.1 NAD(P)-dependent dehydrogenase (short-subunit alcohol dehydrogenase family) [Niveibacterium umoris]
MSARFANYPSLAGRSVFISGGANGIGASLVEHFARQHARVSFVDADRVSGEALAARLTDAAHAPLFLPCDVTDIDALTCAIEKAREVQGPIAVLINNAANDERHAAETVSPDYWEQAMAVNLRHHFFAAQAVFPDMRAAGTGSIINVGSNGWIIKAPGYPLYATAKAAIHGLTRSLAREFGPAGVRVNSLVPGWVMTEKQLRLWVGPEADAEIERNQCLRRRLQTADVARMALFLAADDSAMCSAQDFVVDGGWS